jgi:hypothetical protein
MKSLSIISVLVLSWLSFQDNKLELICQNWTQAGTKNFGKPYQAISPSMAETILFKKDGTYDEVLYGQMKLKGKWKFDKSGSKLAFQITEMNGAEMKDMELDAKHPTDSIMKLTKDTLIYAQLKYYGPNKIYGHDDMYFVRQK